jgi:hypothetical protein
VTAVRAVALGLATAATVLLLPMTAATASGGHVEDAAWYWKVLDTTGTGSAAVLSGFSGVPSGDVAVGFTDAPDKAAAVLLKPATLGLGRDPHKIAAFVAAFTLDPAATQVAPASTSVLACPLLARVVNSTSAQPMAALPDHAPRCVTGTWSADKTQVLFDLRSTAEGWLTGTSLPGVVLTLPGTVTTPTQDVFLREPTVTVAITPPTAESQLLAAMPSAAAIPVGTPPVGAALGGVTPADPVPSSGPAPSVAVPQPASPPTRALPYARAAAVGRPVSHAALVLAGVLGVALLGCCGLSWQGRS